MKKLILCLILLPLLTFGQTVTYVPAQVDATSKTVQRLGHSAILPVNYLDTSKRWPTIIFLHGSGERGEGSLTDLKKTIINGPAKYLKDGKFLILCPQTILWSWRSKWNDGTPRNDANEFVKWALTVYRIDPTRVYITGLSMGGEGTWFAMADEPQLYAAGAPVCGRASRTEGGKVAAGNVHVWAFHGSADTSIPFEGDWNAIGGMRAANKSLIDFTVYERVGHNCWDKAYSNMGLYTWFLKYTR